MTSSRDDWPFEVRWTAYRREGRKRVAIQHPQWQKPMYLTITDAEDLMLQIAEALGVEGPKVPTRKQCQSVCPGMENFGCQAWEDDHTYGKHYHRDGNVSITWT